ncbi:glycosyltransferase [Phenylobacterium sp. LjRoot219]|uniref:hypothetical protein n=1 Tax=Phenylobacterium sp. LjRoot219 TaxID=3342283 RepID=UPI003ECF146C
MTLKTLARREVTTSLGVVPVWSRPEVAASRRPMVLALPGLFGDPEDLANLPEVVAQVADAVLLRLGDLPPSLLADGALADLARAVGEVIDRLYADRAVVVLGASIGATVALGVRAAAVRRIVAIEPILATEALWPLAEPLRGHLRSRPDDPQSRNLFWRLFGVSRERTAPRDHRQALDGLAVPVDVILGGELLGEPRAVTAFPSLVAPAERARLAALPPARLHLAPGVGHNVQADAAKLLKEVVFEACRRASAAPAYAVAGLDEALVEAAPLEARRVAHWGPGGRAFAGAYLSWNPNAEIEVLGMDPAAAPRPAEPYDAVVLGAAPAAAVLTSLAAALRPGGHLLARWTSAQAAPPPIRAALAAAGLALREPVDAGGTGVLRACKAASARPPALRLETVAFANFLMDIRSRLPARGLRSDPELEVAYATAPHTPRPLPLDRPKVLVLQRPGPTSLEQGRALMAFAIVCGWVLVTEYDDHPVLVAEALKRPFGPGDMDRFGYTHALQTTTAPLAEVFRPHVGEVRIFENAVFELAPFPTKPAPRRVFYGAVTRGGFGVEVARSLAPVTAEFPDLEFVVLGDRAVFDALPTANKVYEDYLPYEGYLARMAGCAVSLSPIEPAPGRETKSDAKFLDAARAGVVTIASPLIYDRVIRHGENGLLAPRLEDWAPLLRQALADPVATRAMGRRAWDYVRAERMFARQVAERRDWYRDLWSRREALNRAALARMPGLAAAVAAERTRRGL